MLLCPPVLPNPQDSHPPCRLERLDTDVSSSTDIFSPAEPRRTSSSAVHHASTMALTLLLPPAVLAFSLHFPFVIPYVSSAALATYIPASYRYDAVHTRFDNTAWTYGTDYVLTAVMGIIGCFILSKPGRSSRRLRHYSAALLGCYALSTLPGGYAHQTVVGAERLNAMHFCRLGIVCVGNVSFASCWMGLIGREVARLFDSRSVVPQGPWYFWPVYGSFMTAACALGYMSFKRPACDIFIAGITQFPTTFYCLAALLVGARNHGLKKRVGLDYDSQKDVGSGSPDSHPIDNVLLRYKIMYCVGFIGNAPLLPMYPILVQYSGMSLAGINTLLHSWLMVMWGMQGISLLHLCRVVDKWERSKFADQKKD
ncbi:hypothetical protein ACHAW6_001777 [Cyclotella cf. meneghiniana]